MATQARAVLKIPARIVGGGDVSVTLENGVYVISTAKPSNDIPVNAQTGTSYTLQASDNGALITFDNPSAVTVTVPLGLGVGFNCEIAQLGTGPVTIVGAPGVTVDALEDDTTLPGQYALVRLRAYAPEQYLLSTTEVTGAPGTIFQVSTSFAGVAAMFSNGDPISPPDAASVTSAGVFDSTGKLVRTLWSAEVNHPHFANPVAAWDGTLDTYPAGSLSIAPTGSYIVKRIWHNMEYQWDGVVGNTSPDHSNMFYHNGGGAIADMEITAAGKMYFTTGYNERWPCCGFTTTASPQVMDYPILLGFRSHYSSQFRCCTDGTLVYFGFCPVGFSSCAVYGVQCSDHAIFPFSAGVAYGLFTHVIAMNSTNQDISSLAVNTTGDFLFVAASSLDSVRVFNKTTGVEVSSVVGTYNAPTALATDPTSAAVVWLAYSPGGTLVDTILKLNVSGGGVLSASGTSITVASGNIVSLAVSPDGATLLAVDAGVAQQVRAFNTSDGSVKTAFGASGLFGESMGYVSTPVVSNTRFMFKNRSHFGTTTGWVAYAADGSWWLGDNGNERALHFTSGNSPAYVEQIAYNGGFYSTEVDRTDPTRVMVNFLEYQIDYDFDTITPTNGSWVLLNNWGHSFEFTFGSYTRMMFLGTYSNGRRYATVLDAVDGSVNRIWELTSTGLRDTGVTFPRGWYIDENMNLNRLTYTGGGVEWLVKINQTPFTGFDVDYNPTYGTTITIFTSQVVDLAKFTVPQTDPNFKIQTEGTSNGVIPVYQTYANEAGGNVYGRVGGLDLTTGTIRYNTHQVAPVVPGGGLALLYPEAPFMDWCILGGGPIFYMPGHNNFFTGYRGEEWGNNQTSVFDHWHESGLLLSRFGVVAPYFGAGSLTFPEGHTVIPATGSPTVGVPNRDMSFKGMEQLAGNMGWGNITQVDGVYYFYVNDEWYHGGLQRWSCRGADTIQEQNFAVSWNSASYVSPSDPNNLLLGLPYAQADLANGTAGWTRSPVSNTAYPPMDWKVMTNEIIANPHTPADLSVAFGGEGTATISKTIPRVGSGDWTINSRVYFLYGTATASRLFIEILDNTNKVIVVVASIAVSTSDAGLFVNGTKISPETGFLQDWDTLSGAVRPLVIEADVSSGLLTVTYNEDIIASGVAVSEGGAAIASPAKFQIRGFGLAASSPAVVFTKLDYSEA